MKKTRICNQWINNQSNAHTLEDNKGNISFCDESEIVK